MSNHIGVADVMEDGYVERIGQQEVVKVIGNSVQCVQRQGGVATQGQIDVGAVFMAAFGA